MFKTSNYQGLSSILLLVVDGEESIPPMEDYTIITVEQVIKGRVRVLAISHAVSTYIDDVISVYL